MVFGFLPQTKCAVNKTKKIEPMPKLKVGGGCFWAHMYASNVFLKNFNVLFLL
jgi:hypothetical protein